MRMNPSEKVPTAADIVNTASLNTLANLIFEVHPLDIAWRYLLNIRTEWPRACSKGYSQGDSDSPGQGPHQDH